MSSAAIQAAGTALSLPAADHGDLITALPFFLPAFLIVGAILAMRAVERRRQNDGDDP